MPPEDISVSNSGIVEDEQETVEKDDLDPEEWAEKVRKRTGRGRIDLSLDGICEGATDHYPGVEKSEDTETVEDRLIKNEQRQREEFFREWSLGRDAGTTRGEIDLGNSEDVVKASHDPEGFAEEQDRKRRDRERDELAENIADELESRFTREERREEVSKSGASRAVEKCQQAKDQLDEMAELVREVKADMSA